MIIDQLIAVLGYDVEGEDKLRRFSDSMDGLQKRGAAVAAAMAKFAMVAGAAAVATGGALVRSGLQTIDSQAKLAQSLDTTVSSIQVLERAGDLAGVSMGQVEQATIALTRRLSQAAQGAGPAVDALDRLQLTAEGLAELPLDQRIATIQERIAEFVPEAERAAVASQLFGDRASLVFGRIDSETLRQATQDVKDFGVEVSEQDAAQIERTNDALSRLGLIWRGLSNQLAIAVAPALERFADGMARAANVSGPLGQAISRFGDIMATVMNAAIDGAGRLAERLAGHLETVQGLFEGVDLSGILDSWGLPLALLFARLFPVTSVLILLALAVDDFLTYLAGGDSIIGDFIEALAEFLGTTPEKVTEVLAGMAEAAGKLGLAGIALLLFIGPLRTMAGIFKGVGWLVKGGAALAGFGAAVKTADLGAKAAGVSRMAGALSKLGGALKGLVGLAASGGGAFAFLAALLWPTKMGDGTIPEDMALDDPRLSMTQEEADAEADAIRQQLHERALDRSRAREYDFGMREFRAPKPMVSPEPAVSPEPTATPELPSAPKSDTPDISSITNGLMSIMSGQDSVQEAISGIENFLSHLDAQGGAVEATVTDASQDNRQFPVTVNSTVNQTINGVQNAAPDALRATGNAINQGTEQASRINSAAGAAP